MKFCGFGAGVAAANALPVRIVGDVCCAGIFRGAPPNGFGGRAIGSPSRSRRNPMAIPARARRVSCYQLKVSAALLLTVGSADTATSCIVVEVSVPIFGIALT